MIIQFNSFDEKRVFMLLASMHIIDDIVSETDGSVVLGNKHDHSVWHDCITALIYQIN